MLSKKYLVVAGLVAAVVAVSGSGVSARARTESGNAGRGLSPETRREFTNLRVLPKDISSKILQHIMIDEFEDGLGVGCAFCHAKQHGSEKLDYASDAKPEKEIARNMMRMTLKLNARYFQVHRPGLGIPGLVVTCTTCHQGKPRPDEE